MVGVGWWGWGGVGWGGVRGGVVGVGVGWGRWGGGRASPAAAPKGLLCTCVFPPLCICFGLMVGTVASMVTDPSIRNSTAMLGLDTFYTVRISLSMLMWVQQELVC